MNDLEFGSITKASTFRCVWVLGLTVKRCCIKESANSSDETALFMICCDVTKRVTKRQYS